MADLDYKIPAPLTDEGREKLSSKCAQYLREELDLELASGSELVDYIIALLERFQSLGAIRTDISEIIDEGDSDESGSASSQFVAWLYSELTQLSDSCFNFPSTAVEETEEQDDSQEVEVDYGESPVVSPTSETKDKKGVPPAIIDKTATLSPKFPKKRGVAVVQEGEALPQDKKLVVVKKRRTDMDGPQARSNQNSGGKYDPSIRDSAQSPQHQSKFARGGFAPRGRGGHHANQVWPPDPKMLQTFMAMMSSMTAPRGGLRGRGRGRGGITRPVSSAPPSAGAPKGNPSETMCYFGSNCWNIGLCPYKHETDTSMPKSSKFSAPQN